MQRLMARKVVGRRRVWTQTARAVVDSVGSEPRSPDIGFAEIAEQYRPQLLRVAVRLSGNPETAKDLAQETLIRGLKCFDKFQQGTHAGTWLVKILTNLYFDFLKHQKVVSKAEPDLAICEASDGDSPIATIADVDLYAAIQALEPELRIVVELCYLQEKRYRDAAAALDVPVSTIGTRLMRARARLREILTNTRLDDRTS
jgi:RNA polymerase sigma-70 factor (ECF subfamily)